MKNVTMMFLSTKHVQKGKAFALSLLMGLLLSPLGMMAQSTSTSNPTQAAKQKQEAKFYHSEESKKSINGTNVFSRAELLEMPYLELKKSLEGRPFLVSDLVNAKPEQLKSRLPNLAYYSVSEFNEFPFELKIEALQHPDRYVFTNSKADIPKIEISSSDYNFLDDETKKEIKNSNQYSIK